MSEETDADILSTPKAQQVCCCFWSQLKLNASQEEEEMHQMESEVATDGIVRQSSVVESTSDEVEARKKWPNPPDAEYTI